MSYRLLRIRKILSDCLSAIDCQQIRFIDPSDNDLIQSVVGNRCW